MFILKIVTTYEICEDDSAVIAEATNPSAKVSGNNGAFTAKVRASAFANKVSTENCANTTEATTVASVGSLNKYLAKLSK